jgi:hypothetical protein
VCGACGGAGASVLASGLALAAATAAQASAWLVDLDHDRGDLAASWEAVGRRTTADLLPVAGELTAAHARQAARRHASGVTLLAAPVVPGAAAGWGASAVRALVAAVSEASGQEGRVVVDAGAGLPVGCEGAQILLVCPPTLSGARRAAVLAGHLDGERCGLVVGARAARGEVGARALGRLVGAPVAGELPWSAGEAAALGSGRWPSGRRARLTRAVAALAGGAA